MWELAHTDLVETIFKLSGILSLREVIAHLLSIGVEVILKSPQTFLEYYTLCQTLCWVLGNSINKRDKNLPTVSDGNIYKMTTHTNTQLAITISLRKEKCMNFFFFLREGEWFRKGLKMTIALRCSLSKELMEERAVGGNLSPEAETAYAKACISGIGEQLVGKNKKK